MPKKNTRTLQVELPLVLIESLESMALRRQRGFTDQLIYAATLGLAHEAESLIPKPPPPPPVTPPPAPALSYMAIRMLAQSIIDGLKGRVVYADLPFLLGEIEHYASQCRQMLAMPPVSIKGRIPPQ